MTNRPTQRELPIRQSNDQTFGHSGWRTHPIVRLSGRLAVPVFRAVRRWIAISALCLAAGLAGCGYMIGGAYQAEIRTVHVPVFTTDSFRRGLEFQLTETVQKEIQQQTHFRLAPESVADTRLSGHIVELRKDVLGETTFDDPRELQLRMAVRVTWEDLRTGRVLSEREIPISPETVPLIAESTLAPEVGQSLATGTHQAVDRLARRIVTMMEVPW